MHMQRVEVTHKIRIYVELLLDAIFLLNGKKKREHNNK